MVTARGTRFPLCPILTKFNYKFCVEISVGEEILVMFQQKETLYCNVSTFGQHNYSFSMHHSEDRFSIVSYF